MRFNPHIFVPNDPAHNTGRFNGFADAYRLTFDGMGIADAELKISDTNNRDANGNTYGTLINLYLPLSAERFEDLSDDEKGKIVDLYKVLVESNRALRLTDDCFRAKKTSVKRAAAFGGDGLSSDEIGSEIISSGVKTDPLMMYSELFERQPENETGPGDGIGPGKAQVVSVSDYLTLNLRIPNYQRPYTWSEQSVLTLMDDIAEAVENPEVRYRLGSIIVHEDAPASEEEDDRQGEIVYNVVDGQQRTLTLILLTIALGLGSKFAKSEEFFAELAQNKANARNLRRSFLAIMGCLTDETLKEKIKKALTDQLEIVLIKVDSEAEAFQLFDSQNTRGRHLDPQDLLKAFHLREIKSEEEQREKAERWDRVDSNLQRTDKAAESAMELAHRDLFNLYLYRIIKWEKGGKPGVFTEKDIEMFKGVPLGHEDYGYIKNIKRAAGEEKQFQIGADILPGNSFFDMVELYRNMVAEVVGMVNSIKPIAKVLRTADDGSKAYLYAKQLFYSAALCFYDRFRQNDERAFKKLCAWAFLLRIDLKKIGDKSIIKYAVGGDDPGSSRYTNHISMFMRIAQARLHTEISNMTILIPSIGKAEDRHKQLWIEIKNMIGA